MKRAKLRSTIVTATKKKPNSDQKDLLSSILKQLKGENEHFKSEDNFIFE